MLDLAIGSAAISAFAASNNLLALSWTIPTGMLNVSRMMIGIRVGEEDQHTLTDIMRVVCKRFVPLMCLIAAMIICSAPILAKIFCADPSQPAYQMTVQGLRILPLCMPLAILCTHFSCWWQAAGKDGLVHLVSLLDGVVCVAGFTALLIRPLGINSVYVANVLNGAAGVLIAYSRRVGYNLLTFAQL